jgi:hypothetical protein
VRVEVEPASTVYLGTEDGEDVVLDSVAKAPGAFVDATLEAAGESKDFQLPILDDTLDQYTPPSPTN